jgi:hypothetical protein
MLSDIFSSPFIILIFIAFAIIAIVGNHYSSIAARKRAEGLFELAQRLNLSFNPGSDYALAEQYQFLKKLAQGDNRFAYNVLSGK